MRRDHLVLFFSAATMIGACAPDDADVRVLILHNQSSGSGGDCVLEPNESSFVGFGVIDTNSQLGYVFTPLLKNFSSIPEGGSETQRLFFMEGADVSIEVET